MGLLITSLDLSAQLEFLFRSQQGMVGQLGQPIRNLIPG
jgi:hypothetical protein